ncbi:MAG: M20/M25/M40 family metallo-hydrolase [Deltaproteobacteria bacterium]|nr:M20/M25/M40 family metallo-hydrolase [Deltaproteobacteria bacterium]
MTHHAHAAPALETLKALLRVDTTNPPGNETPAAQLLAERFSGAGLEPRLLHKEPGRDNVVVRLKGQGAGPPLLLTAHLDVVPAERDRWTVPPFDAVVQDGWLWGRGAIDMKHMAAMSAHVLLALQEEGVALKRDVIFAGVADEEAGCAAGSRFLVDQHADLVRAEYALGEVGGFPLDIGPVRYWPIQVAEKGAVRLTLTARGDPGHGSMPHGQQAVLRLAAALASLGGARLPLHVTPPVYRFIAEVARRQPIPAKLVLPLLLHEKTAPPVLDRAIPPHLRDGFAALLADTVSATVLRAGERVNVIPSFATAQVDGRTLPGHTGATLAEEVRDRVGAEIEITIDSDEPPTVFPADTPLFTVLAETLREADPNGVPVPYMIPGYTDAKAWARLGTTCYGFAPTRFPAGSVAFNKLYHGHDERVHVDGFLWGFGVLYRAVKRWCT